MKARKSSMLAGKFSPIACYQHEAPLVLAARPLILKETLVISSMRRMAGLSRYEVTMAPWQVMVVGEFPILIRKKTA